jgi:hypothetical protein
LGILNKFIEPVAGAILRKIVVLVAIILFIQRWPRGLFALKVRTAEGGGLRRAGKPRRSAKKLVEPGLLGELYRLRGNPGPGHPSLQFWGGNARLLGPASRKYVCYALLALSLDLIWGYPGILSLGHGAFFALGAYCMGMYLMCQIRTRGVYGNRCCPT